MNWTVEAAVNPDYGFITGNPNWILIREEFRSGCKELENGIPDDQCDELAKYVTTNNPSLVILRAGKMCEVVGLCNKNLRCDRLTAPNYTEAGRPPSGMLVGPLDLCTLQGVQGGIPVVLPSPPWTNTSCTLSLNDCASGLACEVPDRAIQKCTCVDGLDRCEPQGTCKAFCDLKSTKETIARLNLGAPACTSNTDCVGDLTCTKQDSCKVWACDQNTRQTVQLDCTGRCTPTKVYAVSAQLSDDARTIAVTLNTFAARLDKQSCSSVFNEDSNKRLSNSFCSALDDILTIELSPSATLLGGQNLTFKTGTDLVAAYGATPFSGTFMVIGCGSNCEAPSAGIAGPAIIVPPCDTNSSSILSAAGDLPPSFDASLSSDPSGRVAWADAKWSVVIKEGVSSVFDAVIDKANALPDVGQRLILSLTSADVKAMADGIYELRINVTSWTNMSNMATLEVQKMTVASAPTVEIVGPSVRTYRVSSGIMLSATAGAVCGNNTVKWQWSSQLPGIGGANTTLQELYIPPPVQVEHGSSYTITVAGSFAGSRESNNDTVTVKALGSPPVARLTVAAGNRTGVSGDLPNNVVIVLNATTSVDPDAPATAQSLQYTWSCRREDFPVPCFASTETGDASTSGIYRIRPGLLTNEKSHTFTVTVTKPGGLVAATSAQFRPRDANLKFPRGSLERLCAGECEGPHVTSETLYLEVILEEEYVDAKVAFLSVSIPKIGELTPVYGDGSVKLAIPPNYLPTDQDTIIVVANMSMNNLWGLAVLVIDLDAPPYCASAPANASVCITATLVSGKTQFPNAVAAVRAQGFTDAVDQELTYEFGVGDPDSGVMTDIGSSASASVVGLPRGDNVKVYGCAIDSAGSRVCGTATVTVTAPENFNAADALRGIDLSSILTSGNKKAAMAAAATVSLLFAEAAKGGTLSADDVKRMSDQAGQLLSSLTNNLAAMDPGAAKQLLGTVSNVAGSAPDALNDDAKSKVMDAIKNIMTVLTEIDKRTGDKANSMVDNGKPKAKTSGRRQLLSVEAVNSQNWIKNSVIVVDGVAKGLAANAVAGGDALTSGSGNTWTSVDAVEVSGSGSSAKASASGKSGPPSATRRSLADYVASYNAVYLNRRLHSLDDISHRRHLLATATSVEYTLTVSGDAATNLNGWALAVNYLANAMDSVTTALSDNTAYGKYTIRSGIAEVYWVPPSSASSATSPTLTGSDVITLKIPTSGYDSTKVGTCVLYDTTGPSISGRLSGLTSDSNSPVAKGTVDPSTGLMTCEVKVAGIYVVAQSQDSTISPPPPPPPAGVIASPPPPSPPPPSPPANRPQVAPVPDDDDGLSGGAIAGIVIGSVLGALVIAALIILIVRRRRSRQHVTAGGGGGQPAGTAVAEASQSEAAAAGPGTSSGAGPSSAVPPPGDLTATDMYNMRSGQDK